MTATEQKWIERVEGWQESGLTSEQFSAGRGFSANGLRHWAYKLGKTRRRKPRSEAADLRIVRVVRTASESPKTEDGPEPSTEPAEVVTKAPPTTAALPAPAEASTAPAPAPPPRAPSHGAPPLEIEVGVVRVVVRPGFDRATLMTVLEVLAARGGTR